MPPTVRKLALTAHVTFSMGWLGAVAAFLVLAIAGLLGPGEQPVRAAYQAMDLIGWKLIVPLCFASLLTGVVQALGTPWGLLRHYWVLMKLAATAVLTVLLLVHMQPTRRLAAVAVDAAVSGAGLHQLQIQLAVDAASALLALIVVVALAIYKPQGVTRGAARTPRWVIVFVAAGACALIAVKTLSGAGHHGPAHHFGVGRALNLPLSSVAPQRVNRAGEAAVSSPCRPPRTAPAAWSSSRRSRWQARAARWPAWRPR